MIRIEVASARLAPLAITARRLVVSADVIRSPDDLHRLGLPEREGIDGTRRPVPARLAMAVSHYCRLATDRELNCAAKTAALVGLSVAHDAAPCWFELAPPMRGSSDTLMSLGKHYFRSITTSRYSLGTTSEPG